MIKSVRSAGILLHPTSLPGPYGVGDMGPTAYSWVEQLRRARMTWWQILPLGPPGYGDSPYQCFSAFAGNSLLISPDQLIKDGLLQRTDLPEADFPEERVDFARVAGFKRQMVTNAWNRFQTERGRSLQGEFDAFRARHADWLEDYALFMALKQVHGGGSWQDWPTDLRLRKPDALTQARRELDQEVSLHRFSQFLFFRQWGALKQHAHSQGVRLIGDLPIFVSEDSADVWARPELFLLDEHRHPTVIAGVPPDYFSATGQRWGNPLYNWAALKKEGYAWWVARLRRVLEQVDLVRLDHFRGFEAYWEIPADMPTAQVGRWVKGPGADLFETFRAELGELPLIAEDLGVITPEVEALREQLRLPGMRIMQFAFGGAVEKRFLPHNYDHRTVVYTGTHDNDTTQGWYATLTEAECRYLHRYLLRSGPGIAWDLIRLAWASVADYALAPLQDVLGLGSEGRMNRPGQPSGNWGWRVTTNDLARAAWERLGELTETYERNS